MEPRWFLEGHPRDDLVLLLIILPKTRKIRIPHACLIFIRNMVTKMVNADRRRISGHITIVYLMKSKKKFQSWHCSMNMSSKILQITFAS
jgi:hypothetical protein